MKRRNLRFVWRDQIIYEGQPVDYLVDIKDATVYLREGLSALKIAEAITSSVAQFEQPCLCVPFHVFPLDPANQQQLP